jgi:hypothetical protein
MGNPGCPVTVQTGWNDSGLAILVEVNNKSKPPEGDATRPHLADGVSLWLNTRGSLSGKRANGYCHLLHMLPVGGGDDKTEPVICQGKIPRARVPCTDSISTKTELYLSRSRFRMPNEARSFPVPISM